VSSYCPSLAQGGELPLPRRLAIVSEQKGGVGGGGRVGGIGVKVPRGRLQFFSPALSVALSLWQSPSVAYSSSAGAAVLGRSPEPAVQGQMPDTGYWIPDAPCQAQLTELVPHCGARQALSDVGRPLCVRPLSALTYAISRKQAERGASPALFGLLRLFRREGLSLYDALVRKSDREAPAPAFG